MVVPPMCVELQPAGSDALASKFSASSVVPSGEPVAIVKGSVVEPCALETANVKSMYVPGTNVLAIETTNGVGLSLYAVSPARFPYGEPLCVTSTPGVDVLSVPVTPVSAEVINGLVT